MHAVERTIEPTLHFGYFQNFYVTVAFCVFLDSLFAGGLFYAKYHEAINAVAFAV